MMTSVSVCATYVFNSTKPTLIPPPRLGFTVSKKFSNVYIYKTLLLIWDFHGGSDNKESACNAGDPQTTKNLGWAVLEKGIDYSLQYSCLENSMDRGAWWATVHGRCKELDITKQLLHTHTET